MVIRRIFVVERYRVTGGRPALPAFVSTLRRKPGQRRARALVTLIAAIGLVVSLAVAAVSIGIARAQTSSLTAAQLSR